MITYYHRVSVLQIIFYYSAAGESHISWALQKRDAQLAPTAIVWYDYCLTFDREVEYVWKKKLSFMTTLFFLYRYSVLLSLGVVVFITRTPLSWQTPHSHVSILHEPGGHLGTQLLVNRSK